MAIRFLDFLGGNDSNDGTTYANRFKTPTLGATSGRVSAGDIVRIAKSPDPVNSGINGTWTKGSRLVTLSSPLGGTKTIFRGETNWNVATGVTAVAGANQFRGDSIRGSAITIAAAASTGKIAYALVENGPLDLTGYTRLSFYCHFTAATLNANTLTIKLCSDTTGDVSVASVAVPAIPVTNRWYAFTVDLTGTLGAGIQSVAIYMDIDIAPAQPLYFDQIIACKPASTPGAIHYHTLIGMLSGPTSMEWYRVNGIYLGEQTIELAIGAGSNTNLSAAQARPYWGESYTGILYQRETIIIPASNGIPTSAAVTNFGIGVSGADDTNRITFSGGWDTADSMQTQNGQTIFSSEHCDGGWLMTITARSYLNFDRIGGSGFSQMWRPDTCSYINWMTLGCNPGTANAFVSTNTNIGHRIESLGCAHMNLGSNCLAFTSLYRCDVRSTAGDVVRSNAGAAAAIAVNSCYDCYFDFSHVRLENNNNTGLSLNNSGRNTFASIGSLANNVNYGLQFTGYNFDNVFRGCPELWNNVTAGILFAVESFNNKFYHFNTLGNGIPVSYVSYGDNFFYNLVIQETGGEVSGFPAHFGGRMISVNHDGTDGNLVIFSGYGLTRGDSTTTHDGAIRSVRAQPSSTTECVALKPQRTFDWEFEMEPGVAYTFRAWMYRDNAGITGRLKLEGSQLPGLPAGDTYADVVAVGSWEQVSIGPFTASLKGVVKVTGTSWGGTSYNCYFNDVDHLES